MTERQNLLLAGGLVAGALILSPRARESVGEQMPQMIPIPQPPQIPQIDQLRGQIQEPLERVQTLPQQFGPGLGEFDPAQFFPDPDEFGFGEMEFDFDGLEDLQDEIQDQVDQLQTEIEVIQRRAEAPGDVPGAHGFGTDVTLEEALAFEPTQDPISDARDTVQESLREQRERLDREVRDLSPDRPQIMPDFGFPGISFPTLDPSRRGARVGVRATEILE